MLVTLFVLTTALAVSVPVGEATAQEFTPSASENPVLPHCLVTIKEEVSVPAQEPGVLVTLNVQEGDQVQPNQELGRIDDGERRIQRKLAEIKRNSAKEAAENDVNIRYSRAAYLVAQQEFLMAEEANSKVRGTFPESEVARLRLAAERARLQIEQAEHDANLTGFEVQAAEAEVIATDENIRRRMIVVPIAGEVVERYKHVGEWVQPGDIVLRVVRFDVLRVEGFLNASKYDPGEVGNRPVVIEFSLAHGRKMQMEGKIVYVNSLVEAGGEYQVRAEIANHKENGQWLLRPGLTASMVIQLQ